VHQSDCEIGKEINLQFE